MHRRPVAAVLFVAALVVPLAACGSNDEGSATTTSAAPGTSAIGTAVLPPVVLDAERPTATVKVGTVVTFDMGEPDGGRFVATSADPAVFRIDGEGASQGTFTTNAGGTALASGTAEVAVQFHGSPSGLGTPTTFTITVE